MVFLYILLAILILLLIVALIPIRVRIRADGEISVDLFIAFVRKRLIPQKEKTPRTSDFRIKKFRKRRIKEEKKHLKESEKDKEKKGQAGEKKKTSFKENVSYGTDLINHVILSALRRFGKYLKIYVAKIAVFIGGDEPDKVALSYGAISPSLLVTKELLDSHLNVKYKKGRIPAVTVNADFISGSSSLEADITLSIRVWQLLAVGITALKGFVLDVKKPSSDKDGDGLSNENNKNKDTKDPVKAGKEV